MAGATIYGIKTCDTMKKARAWLDANGIAYTFHDYKTQGVPAEALRRWVGEVGWETVLNRAGTTFRKLPDASKTDLDEANAVALMQEHASAIKRPVLEGNGRLIVGFKPDIYAAAFKG